MKILIMTTVPPQFTCGVNTHVSYLIQGLKQFGINNDLLTYISHEQYSRMAFGKNLLRKLKIDSLDRWLRRQKILHFRRLLRERLAIESYQLIHSHDCYSTCAVLDEIGHKVPIVTTMHGPLAYEMISIGERENSQFVRETFFMEKRAFQNSQFCIAVGAKLKDVMVHDMNVSADKIVIVPNAVNIRHIQSLTEGINSFNLSYPFFLIPRRLVPNSGIEYAIRALKFCRQDISLAIAGKGPLQSKLVQIATELGNHNRVNFLGDVNQDKLMPLIMSSSGVIVPSIPSHGVVEASSLAVLEAMACRKPIIASNIGGISEILQPLHYPFLTEPGDAKQIGRYMDAILEVDGDKMNKILERNFNHLQNKHSLEVWTRAILEVYQSICGAEFFNEKKST